ncbi:MAG: hypothetical protein BGO77_00785 [Caedibacter sp. 37-49]|nr:MAG: hypothetical protein BGO77_00785 [Caedibacter sp. 37-49]
MKKYLLSTVAVMGLSFLINGSVNASDAGNSSSAAESASAGAAKPSAAYTAYELCMKASNVPVRSNTLTLVQKFAKVKCDQLYKQYAQAQQKANSKPSVPSGIPPATNDK